MVDYPRSGRDGLARFVPSLRQVLAVLGIGLLTGVALFALAVVFYPVPEPNEFAVAEATTVTYADGSTEIGDIGEIQRSSIPLSQVPQHVQYAVLAAEDRDFYEHHGFSVSGIARAFVNNITGGETQGGSTITQQYVKNAFLTQDQTIMRKVEELVLAVKMEIVLTKDEILEGYLNTIYFGRGAYGIEAASRVYFGTSASQLSVSQGAALAAIIQSPGNFEPTTNEEALRARWDYVLDGMVEEGWLTAADRAEQKFPRFIPPPSGNRYGGQVGYLLESARQELLTLGFTDAEIAGGGLTVVTNIDQTAQEAMQEAVESQGPTTGTQGLRIGVIAVDPDTGGVLAMYGGEDYVEDSFNNATQASAQAGSTFKPFALVAGFEDDIGLGSMWNGNSPQTIEGYTVPNLGNVSYGTVSLLTATENSINTPFVQLTSDVGVDNVYDAALAAGIPEDTPGLEQNLTFPLGTASPRPIDMAAAYATFAARGQRHTPQVVKEVLTTTGSTAYEQQTQGEQTIEVAIADTVNYALENVVTNGSGYRAQALGRPAAGKTGTTDSNLSAWYVGYTPQVSAAVMMAKSDDDGNPISLSGTGGMGSVAGGSFPAAIWTAFAQGYLADLPVEGFAGPDPDLVGGGGGTQPSRSPSESPSPSPSQEPSASPTPRPTRSSTSPAPTPTASATPTPSASPTPTVSGSPEPSPSGSTSGAGVAATPTPDAAGGG